MRHAAVLTLLASALGASADFGELASGARVGPDETPVSVQTEAEER